MSITKNPDEFWTCFTCTDALLPFFAGGFVLDHESWKKIEARQNPNLICDMGNERYLVIIERTGVKYRRNLYEVGNGNTVLREGLRLHLTGVVREGERHAVFEAETVERLAWQLNKHPDWQLARKEYLSRPVLGDWLRELGVKENL